jgi:PHD/YefM family antitoxin component YafN of YafNO toxin-antitoxin module
MKTLTVAEAKAQLGKLVDKVHNGKPVLLVHKNKLVKLERYEPLDPEYESAELEAMLLEGVRSKFTPYSKGEMQGILERLRREQRKK